MTFIMLNGKAMAAQEAVVSVQDRGFRYGDGVFETIAVHAGVPYRFSWHMQRLAKGLNAIHIIYDVASLQQQCKTLLNTNNFTDGLLRIQITRGIGSRGYLPDKNSTPTVVIETMERPKPLGEPAALWLSDIRRIPAASLPMQSKLSQGLNSTLARMDADAHGCFDALQLTSSGQITETSSANIFWVKDSILYAPALELGVVEGSMRAAVISLSPYGVQEVKAGIDALASAESVFITNTAWHIQPVKSLEPVGLQWKTVMVAKQLSLLLNADIEQHSREHHDEWQTA